MVSQPSVDLLAVELLIYIFELNADMDNDEKTKKGDWGPSPAFYSLLSSSLVCHSWRYIILSSPHLWGRVIDLESLRSVGPQFVDEVLQRTGSAPLCVQGNICNIDTWVGRLQAYEHEEDTFLIPVLEKIFEEDWHRLKSLKLSLTVETDFLATWVPYFQRPSPALVAFSLEYSRAWPSRIVDFDTPSSSPKASKYAGRIFNHDAPFLQHLRLDMMSVDLRSSWISNLRVLDMDTEQGEGFTVGNIVEALSQMPLLERLRLNVIGSFRSATAIIPIKPIRLPRLQSFVLYYNHRGTPLFLDKFVVPAGCCLRLSTVFRREEVSGLKPLVARYAREYFAKIWCTSLNLSFDGDSMYVVANPASTSHQRNFLLELNQVTIPQDSLLSQSDCTHILGAFQDCDFSSVRTLSLDLNDLNMVDTHGRRDAEVVRFINLFENVEVLEAKANTINILCALSETQRQKFPHLRTFSAETAAGKRMPKVDPTPFVSFYAQRREANLTLPILDLSRARVHLDLRWLDEISGLKVVWWGADDQEHEFLCGEGRDAVLLDFNDKSRETRTRCHVPKESGIVPFKYPPFL